MKRVTWVLSVCFVLVATALLSSCQGSTAKLTLSAAGSTTPKIDDGQSITFTATTNSSEGVTWALSGPGTLSGQSSTSATYTAPANADATATVTATLASDKNVTASVTISITAAPSITTTSLPGGIVGTPYNQQIAATEGAAPLSYSISSGALPAGLSISSSGAITGTPSGPASTTPVSFTVKVTDSSNAGAESATKPLSITVSQAPAITSANSTAFVVSTPGSFTVTTTGVPTPSLSETGTLPSGVTFKDNGNGTATLAGTPAAGTAANYAITITAANGVGSNGTQNFTLTVGQAPAITSSNSTTFTAGTAGTFPVTTSGFPAPALSESGALPSGVTFKDNGNGTATLSGTAAAASGGKYPITITASNGVGNNASQSFTLTVDATPAITSANKFTFTVLAPGTFQVTTSGYPTPSIAESGALPTGVTFADNGNGTGTLGGTPAAGTSGSYAITFTPNNGIGSPAAQNFTLTVGQAPAITSANGTTFTVGTAGTFPVTTSGFPKPALSETGALPSGVTFTDNGNGTATLAGTPAAATGGPYPITITASNGVGSNATQSFTLTVDQAPAITSSNATTFSVGGLGSFTVTASGFPAPSVTESGALPSGVTFTGGSGSGTLSGTPASGSNGTYPITFTAANGVGTNATQSFTLTVDTGPVFTSANTATFTVGTAGTFTVTTTGTPTPTLSVSSGTLPSGVTFTDNGNGTGTLAGTPAAGTGGSYAITLKASNSAGSSTQSFTLKVDQAPAITSADNTTFTVGTSASFTVMSTGFPTPALSELGALPSGVAFADNGNGTGTLSGTAASGSNSTYDITFTAANGVGTNATQSFTLTVNTAPVFTTGTSTTFTVGTSGTFTVTATGNPTPTLSESGALPSGVTFTGGSGSGTLSGTPAAGTGGQYAITIKAQSSSGTTTQNFTLTVDEAPAITSANNTTFALNEQDTFTVTTSGYPKNPGMSIVEAGTLPSGVSFTDNGNGTGTLSGTPTSSTGSPFSIVFTANNGIGTAATQDFTLTVGSDPCATAGTGGESLLKGSYAFVLKGFDNGTATGETQPEPALVGGVLTFDGSGGITTGTLDMNLNSTAGVLSNPVTSGTYKIGTSGSADQQRVCMAVTTSAGTQHYRGSINGAGTIVHMIDFDSAGPFVTGEMKQQSSTIPTTLSGNWAFGVSSAQNSANNGGGKFGAVGVLDFTSSGVSGGDLDFNDNGNLDLVSGCLSFANCGPISVNSGGTYVISANGRGTLAYTPSGETAVNAIIYVVSSSDVLVLGNTNQLTDTAFAGEALQQSGTLAPSGTYVGAVSRLGSTSGDSRVDLLRGTFSGGNITNISQYRNDSGTVTVKTGGSGTYTVSATGRMLPNIGGTGPVLYLVSANQAFELNSNTAVESGFFELQTSTASPSGIYAFGTIDPETANVGASDGIAVISGSNITVTNDNNSSGGSQAGVTQSLTFSIDSTGFAIIPSTCSPATNGSCQFVFFVISSTNAVGTDFKSSSPGIQPIDH